MQELLNKKYVDIINKHTKVPAIVAADLEKIIENRKLGDMIFDIRVPTEKVIEKNDIVSVISKYVTLTRRGSNYWACCPFHFEKTPSFAINESICFVSFSKLNKYSIHDYLDIHNRNQYDRNQ